ncbi:hypothetical protein HK102_004576, partial [Quaeritorhiza haematococci]
NCQKACKKCDNTRPCPRCVKYGLQDSCTDSVRKERKKGIKRGPYKRKNSRDLGNMPMPPKGSPNGNGGYDVMGPYHGPITGLEMAGGYSMGPGQNGYGHYMNPPTPPGHGGANSDENDNGSYSDDDMSSVTHTFPSKLHILSHLCAAVLDHSLQTENGDEQQQDQSQEGNDSSDLHERSSSSGQASDSEDMEIKFQPGVKRNSEQWPAIFDRAALEDLSEPIRTRSRTMSFDTEMMMSTSPSSTVFPSGRAQSAPVATVPRSNSVSHISIDRLVASPNPGLVFPRPHEVKRPSSSEIKEAYQHQQPHAQVPPQSSEERLAFPQMPLQPPPHPPAMHPPTPPRAHTDVANNVPSLPPARVPPPQQPQDQNAAPQPQSLPAQPDSQAQKMWLPPLRQQQPRPENSDAAVKPVAVTGDDKEQQSQHNRQVGVLSPPLSDDLDNRLPGSGIGVRLFSPADTRVEVPIYQQTT